MFLLQIIGSFGAAFLLAMTLNRLALVPWRRSAGRHWTERARLLYPARKSGRLNNWLIAANFGFLAYVFWPQHHFLAIAVAGFCGALAAGYFLEREIVPGLPFALWLRLVATALCIFFLWWMVLVFAAFNLPANFSVLTRAIAIGIFLLLLAFQFGLNLLLMKWFGLLQPASNRLQSIVDELSKKMNVHVRATWIFPTYIYNAVALPLTGQLIFTDRLLSTFPDEEVKAVCAHELGHLCEPRKVVFVRSLVPFAFFPIIFARPLASWGDSGTAVYTMLVVGGLVLTLVAIRVARRMEKRADTIAVEQQSDKAVYANALRRLYELNQAPAVMPHRSNKIHPDLYDRMTVAGVTPDFPKPAPPAGLSWTSRLLLFGLVFSALFMIFMDGFRMAQNAVTVNVQ